MNENEKAECLCLFAAAKEGLITKEDFCGFFKRSEKVYAALLEAPSSRGGRPESQRKKMMALLYSFPLWLIPPLGRSLRRPGDGAG